MRYPEYDWLTNFSGNHALKYNNRAHLSKAYARLRLLGQGDKNLMVFTVEPPSFLIRFGVAVAYLGSSWALLYKPRSIVGPIAEYRQIAVHHRARGRGPIPMLQWDKDQSEVGHSREDDK